MTTRRRKWHSPEQIVKKLFGKLRLSDQLGMVASGGNVGDEVKQAACLG